jgi:hypothetical protein
MRIEKGNERGVKISATFDTDHVDMKPLGDIDKMVRILRVTHPEVNFSFEPVIQTQSQSKENLAHE